MKKLQTFTKKYQKELNYHIKDNCYTDSKMSLLNNHLLLTTEVAEIAELLRELFTNCEMYMSKGYNEDVAFEIAKSEITEELGKEISDCLAYLTKLANYFDRDMEKDFYNKMEEVRQRVT